MILLLTILSFILIFVFEIIAESRFEDGWYVGVWVSIIAFIFFITFGIINGSIKYPKTEGTHQGIITAIDQEGLIFNHYKIYLKSSGYTNQSDETEYCAYLEEVELINNLKQNIGKQVRLKYGHDGGYIGIKNCGTYHIKDFEVVKEKK